jgi:serine/threonine protein kinase
VEATVTGRGIPISQRNAMLRSPMRGELAPDVVVAERFQLVRELGRGGMGAVWLAHHLGLGVLCAVKFDLTGAACLADLRRRFEREARAAALLRSPHVVQMLDHGIWDDRPYIAMEYLEGEDLRRRLDRVKRLSAEETERLVAQVARGLSKAHAASVIHRDLKPDNIFLTPDSDGEVAKILDFGIATAGGPAGLLTSTTGGGLLGTPAYMSPEQLARIGPVDHRCDLWALGVIVFECLAGKRPFEGQSLGELVLQILSRPIPAASSVAPDLPAGFDAWWARASARDPKRRFQSAREFAEALAEALCEESTWPPSEHAEVPLSSTLGRESAPSIRPLPAGGEVVTQPALARPEPLVPTTGAVIAEPSRLPGERARDSRGSVCLPHHQGVGRACSMQSVAEQNTAIQEARPRLECDPERHLQSGMGQAATELGRREAATDPGRLSSPDPAVDGAVCSTGAIEPPRAKRPSNSFRLVGRIAAAAMVLIGVVTLLIRWTPRSHPEPSAAAPSMAPTASPVATPSPAAELTAKAAPVASATAKPVLVAPGATAPSPMGTLRPAANRSPAPARSSGARPKVSPEPVDPSLFDQRK